MPVYFGIENKTSAVVAPSVAAKGLDLLKVAPSQLATYSRFEYSQPLFSIYKDHLSAYMHARETQQRVSLHPVGHPLSIKINNCFPIEIPDLIVSWARNVSSEALQTLKNIGFENIKAGNRKDAMLFERPSYAEVVSIMRLGPQKDCQTNFGSMNGTAFDVLLLIVKIFSSFFRTHHYPAFHNDEELHGALDLGRIMEIGGSKRQRSPEAEDSSRKKSKGKAPSTASEPDVDTETEEMNVDDENAVVTPAVKIVTKVGYAKPSDDTSHPWGTSSDIPNDPGLFLQFIPDLASPDSKMVPMVIMRYFLGCLGQSPLAIKDVMAKIRSGWGNLESTLAGHVLSHLAKCIDLALTAQARVFPIFENGQYCGSLLNGAGFTLVHHGIVFKPLDFGHLQSDVGSARLHSTTLHAIANILGMGPDEIEACKSMRILSSSCRKCSITEEEKDQIKKLAADLIFPQRFWSLNTDTILRALGQLDPSLTTSIDDIWDQAPLHHSQIFSSSKVAHVLAQFGFMAPTFNIPSCPEFVLSKNIKPKKLVIRPVALHVAIADFENVLRTKKINNSPTTMSTKFQYRDFGGMQDAVWAELRKAAGGIASDDLGAERVDNVPTEDVFDDLYD